MWFDRARLAVSTFSQSLCYLLINQLLAVDFYEATILASVLSQDKLSSDISGVVLLVGNLLSIGGM